MINKLTFGLAIVCSGFVTNSFADCQRTPFGVGVPCFNGNVTLGVSGLYLQPNTSDLNYATVYPLSDDPLTPQVYAQVKRIRPDYDWGYHVNLGYEFKGTGNDIQLSYSDLNAHTSNNFNVKKNELLVGTIAPFNTQEGDLPGAGVHTDTRFRYHVADLEIGQHLQIGCNTNVRLLAGIRYANINSYLNADYSVSSSFGDDLPPTTILAQTNQSSRFNGVGPRLGMSINYHLGNGFGIGGQATSALLVGRFRTNYHELDKATFGSLEFHRDTSLQLPRETRVVPNLTGKVGVNYNYQFCNASRSVLTLEAGYMVDQYFNANDRIALKSQIPPKYTQKTLDTSFSGPYVGFQLHI